MNIIYNIDKYNKNKISFSDSKRNILMDGKFTKILFSESYFSLVGIYLKINFNNTRLNTINNKHILKLDKNLNNDKIIKSLVQIEFDILNYYKVLFDTNKKISFLLKNYLLSGNIRIYMNDNNYEGMLYILKISGVWESEDEIGITYKFLKSNNYSFYE
tara:strand:+ start:16536 stop:17012 length:477 start_codon:yes stop_codon:yes gene_type:complete